MLADWLPLLQDLAGLISPIFAMKQLSWQLETTNRWWILTISKWQHNDKSEAYKREVL